jgi:hypothetical protein
MLLNVIALGRTITDNINRVITKIQNVIYISKLIETWSV